MVSIQNPQEIYSFSESSMQMLSTSLRETGAPMNLVSL